MRIFTPTLELPFAGHPTVGTGVLLAQLNARDMMGRPGGVVIALEQQIGLVKVEVTTQPGRAARGVFSIPRLPERVMIVGGGYIWFWFLFLRDML